MRAIDMPTRLLRVAAAVTVAASGYIHAQLYVDGYRYIHVIGAMFLLQAAVSFAVAAILLTAVILRPSMLIDVLAAGTTLGALAGFVASRTIGVFGFTEHGLEPAPQALASILVEITTLALLAVVALRVRAAPA
jgi:hypothetical protein